MKYDKKKYKIYTWKSFGSIHWVLNPVLFINELIFGQRVPKLAIEDKSMDKPRFERTFVPCPHCGALHDGRVWATQNGTAFKNWFGLYCKDCGQTIPCLRNGLSALILLISFPLWGWFRKSLKAKWLDKQAKRYEHINVDTIKNPFVKGGWIKLSLFWAIFMFLIMGIAFPYYEGDEITSKSLIQQAVLWTIAGLGYGYTMKWFMNKKIANKARKS